MPLLGDATRRTQVRCDKVDPDCMAVATIAFTGTRPPGCQHGPPTLWLAFCRDHEDAYLDGLQCAVCDAVLTLSQPIRLATTLPNGRPR